MKNWIYITDDDNTTRYALGVKGKRPLVCIGANPSTARPDELDPTLKSVERIALNNGYDGWIMINLCPLRFTDPKMLPECIPSKVSTLNLQIINDLIGSNKSAIWAAWGKLIMQKDYLFESLAEIYCSIDMDNTPWLNYGALTRDGHPHHPLYLKYSETFHPFAIHSYLLQHIPLKDTSTAFIPVYYDGDSILLSLAEDVSPDGENIIDSLVLEIDLAEGRINGKPWSCQKMLKYNPFSTIPAEDRQLFLNSLFKQFNAIQLQKIMKLLLSPPHESIESLIWLPDRLKENKNVSFRNSNKL